MRELEILAVKRRLDRVHDHLRGHVVDPEILLPGVAEGGDGIDRAFLGIFHAHLAVDGTLMITGDQRHRIFGQMLQLAVLLLLQIDGGLPES